MIYEVRTYDIKIKGMRLVEDLYAKAYEHRKQYSTLAAAWHTEIGPLYQLITVWPYEDMAHFEKVQAQIRADKRCMPAIRDSVAAMRSDIVRPAPFSPELKPGKAGPFFEMRTYTVPYGEMPLLLDNWEKVMPKRVELSPVTAMWYSEVGDLNQWTHIWPYESLDQRMDVRDRVRGDIWPPSRIAEREGRTAETYLKMENKLLLATHFSPIQ